MSLSLLTFYLLAGITLASAVMVVTRKNPIFSALYLALSLIAVAGLFVSERAEFLFAAQILVYTGGIMVLFMFVIMLVNLEEEALVRRAVRYWWAPVALVGFSIAVLVVRARGGSIDVSSAGQESLALGNVEAVAAALLTDYLYLFEVISVLLQVAMVGAIVLSRKEL